MRLSSSKTSEDGKAVDPTDQDSFTRPVTLHRRDPRQPPAGRPVLVKESMPEAKPIDDKEAERLQQAKADREAQRAMDQAKIAPSVKDMTAKKQKKPKEEKISFNRMPRTEQGRKEADLRYEEALPWHLEDVDAHNVWLKDDFRNHGQRSRARPVSSANEVRGYDEVDMEGDEFDDDDENPGFENDDEDTKISNNRIRQNQLGANLFGDGDENEVDAREESEMRRELERRKATKKLKKTLIKRENINDIESDDTASSADPFADSSSEDEEEEEEDGSQIKLEDEDKVKTDIDKGQSSLAVKGSRATSLYQFKQSSNSPSKEGHGARSASPKPAIEAWEIVQALPQLPDGITITNF
ncbi:unnamed protein product [Parascedosporium putredinis]|uniref:Uncharacterized protein n=1 Tax=Parascedosporium putredinis TaxID=1442378 RepID=A0A9P1GY86_9PEZI|nr:unnamed protein product [Parascedosporium putredinis]CAI7991483.1 unnamed protein product [Parascedosporium putredinis]